MGKYYRWGILGAGRIAEKFCTAIRVVTGSEVYAVASRDARNAQAFAERHGAARWYSSYDDLLNDATVDIIYIATPHAFHYEQVMRCVQAKKAVLCKKPISLGYRQTAAMIAAAVENN